MNEFFAEVKMKVAGIVLFFNIGSFKGKKFFIHPPFAKDFFFKLFDSPNLPLSQSLKSQSPPRFVLSILSVS
ncbi:MAG: hypothetical protein FD155_3388 [Bacteroidetes bacterium]|nr:MAG: hypothetical protein FD155_3388 [Bacteroidota bacterium]